MTDRDADYNKSPAKRGRYELIMTFLFTLPRAHQVEFYDFAETRLFMVNPPLPDMSGATLKYLLQILGSGSKHV